MSYTYPDKKLIKEALRLLSETYPNAGPELEFSTPFELLVATILSAQCTDKQVNKATRVLFKAYATAADFAQLHEDELAPYIKTCGFFNTKGKNIIETSKRIQADFGGSVPDTLEELIKLPGVGRKTANVVMANAFGKDAIAVDTHVFRVSNRIGLAEAKDVYKTELQLMDNIPKRDWSKAHHYLIFHGRRVCSARSPRCEMCTVAPACAMNLKRS